MRAVQKISQVLMWIFMGFYILLNGVAISAILVNKSPYNPAALVVFVGLMLLACILFFAVRKWRMLWVILAILAGVAVIAIAMNMRYHFPVTIETSGERGLSTWDIIWRHAGTAIVAVFMVVAWITGNAADKADEEWRRVHSAGRKYDLSGDRLFKDRDSNGRAKRENNPDGDRYPDDEEIDRPYIVEPDEEDVEQAKRPKRSVRRRLEKESK